MNELTEYIIEPKTEKGRAFRAFRLAAVTADGLWDVGSIDKHKRPVYATFATSEGEARPFLANLLTGRPAVPLTNSSRGAAGYEFLRSAGYRYFQDKGPAGTIVTVYLPDLFALDPGMVDPDGVKFVVLPPSAYLAGEAHSMPVGDMVTHARRLPWVRELNQRPGKDDWRRDRWQEPLPVEYLRHLAPLSYLFALYLSNRSRAPIPPDGRFYFQLMLACLREGVATLPTEDRSYHYESNKFGEKTAFKFTAAGLDVGGLGPAIAFSAKHNDVEGILAAECSTYFEMTGGKTP